MFQPPVKRPRQYAALSMPMRFVRMSVLIIGCGDIGLRITSLMPHGVRLLALSSDAGRVAGLRSRGIVPLTGNLDLPSTLRRLAALATRVLYLAPPPAQGSTDPRLLALVRCLRRHVSVMSVLPRAVTLVYASTSGVYGDCCGDAVTETRPPQPTSDRARRRMDAEHTLRTYGRQRGVRCTILRIPGIYAPDRPGGTPRDRLLQGTPTLQTADDVFSNHIHADDLARACIAALWRGQPQRVYHVNDDSHLLMGDYFDLAADLYGLARPPRLSRHDAQRQLSPMQMSFMSESRRMDNTRLKTELRLRLRYPTVAQGLNARPKTPKTQNPKPKTQNPSDLSCGVHGRVRHT